MSVPGRLPSNDETYEDRPRLDVMLLRAGPARIVRQSLSEQAAQAVRARIYALQLPPGTRLVIDDLAAELGVSRTPVREGLRQLVAEGLVTYDGNSYVVTTYSRHDIIDLFAIRQALEVLAASQAAERMPAEAIRDLRARCEEGRTRIAAGDAEYLITLDMDFHNGIAEGTQNGRLKSLLASLQEQAWLIRRWGFLPKLIEFVETITVAEHLAVLDRLLARDSAGAARLMEEHLRLGQQRTLKWLKL